MFYRDDAYSTASGLPPIQYSERQSSDESREVGPRATGRSESAVFATRHARSFSWGVCRARRVARQQNTASAAPHRPTCRSKRVACAHKTNGTRRMNRTQDITHGRLLETGRTQQNGRSKMDAANGLESSRAERSEAEWSGVERGAAESSRVESSRARPSRVESRSPADEVQRQHMHAFMSACGPHLLGELQPEPTQPSRVEPSRASRTKSSDAERAKSS